MPIIFMSSEQKRSVEETLRLAADKLEDWGMDLQQDITAEQEEVDRWKASLEGYKLTCGLLGITPEPFPKEMTHVA